MNDSNDGLVDLHCHCSASGGAIGTPMAVAAYFRQNGYRAFALTDHDSLEGQDATVAAARREGVEFIHGVEFSASIDDPDLPGETVVHVLGYLYQRSEELAELSRRNVERTRRRLRHLVDRLREEGIADVTEQQLVDHIKVRFGADDVWKWPYSLGPIGDLLRRRGVEGTENGNNAVRRLAERLCGDLKQPPLPDVTEVRDTVHRAGGVVLLAHPGGGRDPSDEEARRLERWLNEYVDGLEVYTPKHRPAYRKMQMEIVRRMGRPFSGGSDRHEYGSDDPNPKTSDAPYACLESLREFRARR